MRVAISKFADLAFCELKIVHTFIDARQPSFRPCVAAGARQHAESAREDAEREWEETTAEEVLQALQDPVKSLELPSESVSVRFNSNGHEFAGRLDKLVKQGSEAVVVDEKFTGGRGGCFRQKYVRQLSSYCFGLANGSMSVCGVEIGERVLRGMNLSCRIVERDIHSREIVGEVKFGFDEKLVESSAERFAEILNGGFERRELACGELEKCVSCEYRRLCEYRAY